MSTQMSPSRIEGLEELFNRTQPVRLTYMVDKNGVRALMSYFREYDEPHAKAADFEQLIEHVYACFEYGKVLTQKDSGYTYNCSILDIMSKLMNDITRVAMISYYFPNQYGDLKQTLIDMTEQARSAILERTTIKIDLKFSK